jgi:carbon monoxide dehydrogenase subunit G
VVVTEEEDVREVFEVLTRVRAFRRVARPVEQVWDVLQDHQGMSTWSPGVRVSLERQGQPTANGIGAIRAVRMLGLTIREQVTGMDPQERLAYRALSGIPLRDYAGEVFLAPDPAGTGVTWTLSTSSRLPGTRMLLALNSRAFARALQRSAERQYPESS